MRSEQERVDAAGEHFARANAASGADITILEPNGQLVDEIVTSAPLESALPESMESQMRAAGESLGASACRYVKQRHDDSQ